jgi:Mg-chelatase subunit ChlD
MFQRSVFQSGRRIAASPYVRAGWCAAALFLAVSASPQQPQSQQQAAPPQAGSFKTSTSEVIVPVTVTDDKNRFVSNLEAGDFKVFDQGKEQKIEFFSRDRNQPVVVGFLLDLSNSNRLHWKTFQEAAKELVWALLPGDRKYSGYLITYGNDAELAVNTTIDSDKITEKIAKLKPGGGAALYDAIYMACTNRQLVKGEPYEPRRVIIIITQALSYLNDQGKPPGSQERRGAPSGRRYTGSRNSIPHRPGSVVPDGTRRFLRGRGFPALKCWAKFCRPYGTGSIAGQAWPERNYWVVLSLTGLGIWEPSLASPVHS